MNQENIEQLVPEEVLDILRERAEATSIAVVGASNNPEKYGNIIVRNLHKKGYRVLPVNPREEQIADLEVYPSVTALPLDTRLVCFVTPPKATRLVLEKLDPTRFKIIWFQDGSSDDETLAFARQKFETIVAGACIMVVTGLTFSRAAHDGP